MNVKLIAITPDAEKTMIYIARVSSDNQDNPDYSGLLKYCLDHHHWSVFEHAHATVEIETSRAIAAQILRHRSFCFQEFSQRYSEPDGFELYHARRQAEKNRQSSVDDLPENVAFWWHSEQLVTWDICMHTYEEAVNKFGIARECARMILPLNTTTRLYMTGNIRSWIHYIQLRTARDTQLEHREIALAIRDLLKPELPVISEAMGW